jgi:hypothetical protein
MTQQLQTSIARIQATTSRTQTAKAKLGTKTPKTQPAKARIRVSTQRTQTALARIRAITQKTQTALARIQATTNRTQAAKARISALSARTQAAKARIRVIAAKLQTARARIAAANLAIRPAAKPGLFIQYGDVTLDESNGILITSPFDAADTSVFGNWYCEFRVRLRPEEITGNTTSDDATFATRIANIDTKLRLPRQRLLVQFGSTIYRDWNFNLASQTAFLITPELDLIKENRRDFTYGFRVRCQFPGNIPNNAFRRESLTNIIDGLMQRRIVSSTATWTSSPGVNAYDQYLTNGENFFNAYLPPNRNDQYGNQGQWIRADENPVSFNDEKSICTASRVYWEVFAGRRDSLSQTLTIIDNRRVFICPSTWAPTATGTALQNYLDGGDIWYNKNLPAPSEANASWVLISDNPQFNDRDGPLASGGPGAGVLTVTRTYHEVVKGLREFHVEVNTAANQLRQIVIHGFYYPTGAQTAQTNYTNGIQLLVSDVLKAQVPPVTRYESLSVPKYEGYGTKSQIYFFRHTYNEIAYPQGQGGTDDPNITISSLDIDTDVPADPQSQPTGVTLTRLQRVTAKFTAIVNYQKNQDPAKLWTPSVRPYILNAVATKLGAAATVDLYDEQVGVGLHNNTLHGTLFLFVTGGSTLSMKVWQKLILIPGREFVPRGDGTNLTGYPYRRPVEKILIRHAEYEYVVNNLAAPDPFNSASVSGFGMISTGKKGIDSWNEQNDSGPLQSTSGWFIDSRSPEAYSEFDFPTTRGVGFQTNYHIQHEVWRYLSSVDQGPSIP